MAYIDVHRLYMHKAQRSLSSSCRISRGGMHDEQHDTSLLLRAPIAVFSRTFKERFMDTNTQSQTPNGSDKLTSTTNAAQTTLNDTKGATQRVASTLRSELTNLKGDLDALVSRASSLSDEDLSRAHTQLMAKFSSMRYAAKGMADEATRQFNRGMETTTTYVKDRPMQSVAVAVGAGLLLGMLLKRR